MNPAIGSKILYILVFIFATSLPIHSYAQEWVVDLTEVRSLIDHWTEVHNTRNLTALEKMYSNEVIFYADTLPKVSCMEIKSKRLQSKKYFHLEVIGSPVVTTYASKAIKVAFIKRVTSGSSTTDYDAYLLLKQINGKLFIVGESDMIADGKAGYSPDLGKELKQARLSKELPVPTQDKLVVPDKSTNHESPDKSSDQEWITIIAIGGFLLFVIIYNKRKRNPIKQWPTIERPNLSPNIPPQPEKDGYAFEQFIANRFDTKYFKVIEWRSDKIVNGIYAESSKYPDLEIEFHIGGDRRNFAVECKYRRAIYDGIFKLEKRQFDNYNSFKESKKMPVYVALGVGGNSQYPIDLFIIPLGAFGSDGIIRFETILEFYNNPGKKFFYDLQKNELSYYRKAW